MFLTGIKLVVGLMTGSLGILAEAAHSALDLVAAAITLLAVSVSDRPAAESILGRVEVENFRPWCCPALHHLRVDHLRGLSAALLPRPAVDANIWAFLTVGASIVIDVNRSWISRGGA